MNIKLRTAIFTTIINLLFANSLPYPVIFVHGIVGSDESFSTTMNHLQSEYDLGPINVFDVLLNADNDFSACSIETDVAWEDFIFEGHDITLGRRSYHEDLDEVTDGWIESNIFAINFIAVVS